MGGHAPTMLNIQWGSTVLFHISLWNEVYYTTNAGMHCKRCGRTAIALGTATSSSEFKNCIQPIMDGQWLIFGGSLWYYLQWARMARIERPEPKDYREGDNLASLVRSGHMRNLVHCGSAGLWEKCRYINTHVFLKWLANFLLYSLSHEHSPLLYRYPIGDIAM